MEARTMNTVPKDAAYFPDGVTRCSLDKFLMMMGISLLIFLWGCYAAGRVLYIGLEETGLNNHFAFGAWITFDLAVIALGAGAFFTGFLRYILNMKELDKIINLTVVLGFSCYTGALIVLLLEIGQPLRAWFVFWHANVHSMLTEVVFCITVYTIVLVIEYIPLVLENKVLNKNKLLHSIAHNLHIVMPVFAGIGAFLSTFHQGSLGGISGVMFGRAFFYRDGFFIWPWTFFLFVISAAGSGPMFTVLIGSLMEKITGKQLIPFEAKMLMAKISGTIMLIYGVLKIMSAAWWANGLLPQFGLTFSQMFYGLYFGQYIFWIELSSCIPALLLLMPKYRNNTTILYGAGIWLIVIVSLNRYVQVIQGQAFPSMPFQNWEFYSPSWVEWSTCLMVIPYVVMLLGLTYRYLPLFPYEKDLNK